MYSGGHFEMFLLLIDILFLFVGLIYFAFDISLCSWLIGGVCLLFGGLTIVSRFLAWITGAQPRLLLDTIRSEASNDVKTGAITRTLGYDLLFLILGALNLYIGYQVF